MLMKDHPENLNTRFRALCNMGTEVPAKAMPPGAKEAIQKEEEDKLQEASHMQEELQTILGVIIRDGIYPWDI